MLLESVLGLRHVPIFVLIASWWKWGGEKIYLMTFGNSDKLSDFKLMSWNFLLYKNDFVLGYAENISEKFLNWFRNNVWNRFVLPLEVVARSGSVKKLFLKISQNSQENNCARVSFFNKTAGLRPATLLKKETLAQVFSRKFCEIFKNTFFIKHLQWDAASVTSLSPN